TRRSACLLGPTEQVLLHAGSVGRDLEDEAQRFGADLLESRLQQIRVTGLEPVARERVLYGDDERSIGETYRLDPGEPRPELHVGDALAHHLHQVIPDSTVRTDHSLVPFSRRQVRVQRATDGQCGPRRSACPEQPLRAGSADRLPWAPP